MGNEKEYRRRVKELLKSLEIYNDAMTREATETELHIRLSDVLGKAMNVQVMEREDG